MVYRTHTPEETKKVAAEFAASLEGGEVIFLEGELGAGKTTFVQGVAGALGFDGVNKVRQGKVIELDLNQNDPEKAKSQVENMCEKLLANTVIENYSVEIL